MHNLKYHYEHDEDNYTVSSFDRTTGKFVSKVTSEVGYPHAKIQMSLDLAKKEKERYREPTNVRPYDLTFKDSRSHPTFQPTVSPNLDAEFEEILIENAPPEALEEISKYTWSSDSSNQTGIRDLLQKGTDRMPFLEGATYEDFDIEGEPMSDDFFNQWMDEDATAMAVGHLQSFVKMTTDDEGEEVLLEVPKTVSDPGFLAHLTTIEPPEGKTHDLNMDPGCGDNRTGERSEVVGTTAQYLYDKVKKFQYHYDNHVRLKGQPTLAQTFQLVEDSMKKDYNPPSIFTSYKFFHKSRKSLKGKGCSWYPNERYLGSG